MKGQIPFFSQIIFEGKEGSFSINYLAVNLLIVCKLLFLSNNDFPGLPQNGASEKENGCVSTGSAFFLRFRHPGLRLDGRPGYASAISANCLKCRYQ